MDRRWFILWAAALASSSWMSALGNTAQAVTTASNKAIVKVPLIYSGKFTPWMYKKLRKSMNFFLDRAHEWDIQIYCGFEKTGATNISLLQHDIWSEAAKRFEWCDHQFLTRDTLKEWLEGDLDGFSEFLADRVLPGWSSDIGFESANNERIRHNERILSVLHMTTSIVNPWETIRIFHEIKTELEDVLNTKNKAYKTGFIFLYFSL